MLTVKYSNYECSERTTIEELFKKNTEVFVPFTMNVCIMLDSLYDIYQAERVLMKLLANLFFFVHLESTVVVCCLCTVTEWKWEQLRVQIIYLRKATKTVKARPINMKTHTDYLEALWHTNDKDKRQLQQKA